MRVGKVAEKNSVGKRGVRGLQAFISTLQVRTILALFLSIVFLLLMNKKKKNKAVVLVLNATVQAKTDMVPGLVTKSSS